MQIKRPALISIVGAIGCLAMLCCFLAVSARAEEIRAGDLVITQAWSRATPGGAKIGGGYLTIENKGSAPDRLIGGSADVAGNVQVHEMAMNNGVMTMRPLDKGLTIEPGKTVRLAPGGYHLMLFDLKSPLKQGDQLPVTLEFEKSGQGEALARRAGRGRAGTRRGERFRRSDAHEEDALRDEDVRPMMSQGWRSRRDRRARGVPAGGGRAAGDPYPFRARDVSGSGFAGHGRHRQLRAAADVRRRKSAAGRRKRRWS